MRRRGALIPDRTAGYLFTTLGGLLVCAALAIAAHRLLFLAHAKTADASVVGDVIGRGRHGPTHCPVLSYQPAGAGERIDVQSRYCTSGAALAVGSRVRVLYDPAHADEAEPVGFPLFALVVAVLLPLGVAFVIGGFAFFRRRDGI